MGTVSTGHEHHDLCALISPSYHSLAWFHSSNYLFLLCIALPCLGAQLQPLLPSTTDEELRKQWSSIQRYVTALRNCELPQVPARRSPSHRIQQHRKSLHSIHCQTLAATISWQCQALRYCPHCSPPSSNGNPFETHRTRKHAR